MDTTHSQSVALPENELLNELSMLIEKSRQHVARQANSTLTMLFWSIGKRI
jgi:hypothetical protein